MSIIDELNKLILKSEPKIITQYLVNSEAILDTRTGKTYETFNNEKGWS